MDMRPYAKAIASALVSGLIAFLSSLLTALQGENSGFGTITAGQWVTAALAFLIGLGLAGGVTHQVTNRPATQAARASSSRKARTISNA
jgi:hypothetical protein